MMPSHPDPLPGDFDEELGSLDTADAQVVQPSREHHLIVQFTLEGTMRWHRNRSPTTKARGRARSLGR
jgi:hypothetical protein